MKKDIRGIGVALVTPFNADGQIDYDSLERLIEHVIDGGVDYLVVLGTTGEPPTLSCEEKASVISFVKKINSGRLPLIVGAGGFSTSEVLHTIKNTDLEGVTALLSVTPYYNKPTQEGLYEHYKAIAAASPIPVLLYNVPARTGVNMLAETTLRIAHEVDNVMGIKEASGIVGQMARILSGRPEGFKVISGDDMLILPLIAMGGDGVISVGANALPGLFSKMTHAAGDGDFKTSSEICRRLVGIIDAMFEECNPSGVKTALSIIGVTGKYVRLPLVPGSELLRARMEVLMKEFR